MLCDRCGGSVRQDEDHVCAQVVHCETLRVGDVVRRPSPNSEWREVTAVDRGRRQFATGDTLWTWGRGHVWMCRQV